jgi:hypothetical protein
MNSNGIILNNVSVPIEPVDKIGGVFLSGDILFYVQLTKGLSSQKLHVGENIQCRVVLKFQNPEDNPSDNLYLYFYCRIFYSYCNNHGIPLDSLISYSALHRRHLFPLKYDTDKKQYYAIFGNNLEDYQLQLLEPNDYLCCFTIVQRCQFGFKWTIHPDVEPDFHGNGLYDGAVHSDPFLISVKPLNPPN